MLVEDVWKLCNILIIYFLFLEKLGLCSLLFVSIQCFVYNVDLCIDKTFYVLLIEFIHCHC